MSDYKEKSKKYSGGIKALLSDWMIVFLFIVLFILCCFNSNFRTYTNIMNVLRQASFVAIIAMGEFFVYRIVVVPFSVCSTAERMPADPVPCCCLSFEQDKYTTFFSQDLL